MYSILNESLGWSETSLPSEKLMLISDSLAADGAFLLPHFINYYIKSKQRVIIVGLEQGFSHYLTICKKLVRRNDLLSLAVDWNLIVLIVSFSQPVFLTMHASCL